MWPNASGNGAPDMQTFIDTSKEAKLFQQQQHYPTKTDSTQQTGPTVKYRSRRGLMPPAVRGHVAS
jgi:hypothetical protein